VSSDWLSAFRFLLFRQGVNPPLRVESREMVRSFGGPPFVGGPKLKLRRLPYQSATADNYPVGF